MNTKTNGTTAAKVENYERLTGNEYADRLAAEYNAEKKPEPIREDKTGRECYAFALYVNGEFTRFITAESWHTKQEAEAYASGMSLCALAFRRTASIAVYKKESNDVWQLYYTRQSFNRDRMYYKIHASRLKGCELVRPTEDEERAFTALPNFHRLPFMDVAALPVGWNEPAPFFVAGMRYRCTRDVVMKKSRKKAFRAGTIYEQTADPSPFYGWLTNEQGERHAWAQPAELAEHCKTWNSKPEDNDPRQYFEAVGE